MQNIDDEKYFCAPARCDTMPNIFKAYFNDDDRYSWHTTENFDSHFILSMVRSDQVDIKEGWYTSPIFCNSCRERFSLLLLFTHESKSVLDIFCKTRQGSIPKTWKHSFSHSIMASFNFQSSVTKDRDKAPSECLKRWSKSLRMIHHLYWRNIATKQYF